MFWNISFYRNTFKFRVRRYFRTLLNTGARARAWNTDVYVTYKKQKSLSIVFAHMYNGRFEITLYIYIPVFAGVIERLKCITIESWRSTFPRHVVDDPNSDSGTRKLLGTREIRDEMATVCCCLFFWGGDRIRSRNDSTIFDDHNNYVSLLAFGRNMITGYLPENFDIYPIDVNGNEGWPDTSVIVVRRVQVGRKIWRFFETEKFDLFQSYVLQTVFEEMTRAR